MFVIRDRQRRAATRFLFFTLIVLALAVMHRPAGAVGDDGCSPGLQDDRCSAGLVASLTTERATKPVSGSEPADGPTPAGVALGEIAAFGMGALWLRLGLIGLVLLALTVFGVQLGDRLALQR